MRIALALVSTLCLLGLEAPAAAKQCEREEPARVRQLERALARCQGDPTCAVAAADKCFVALSSFGCDVSACTAVGPPRGGAGDMCAFKTAEGASMAIDDLLTNQVEPALNASWHDTAVMQGLDPYSTGKQETTIPDGCSKGADLGNLACAAELAECKKVVADYDLTLTGLADLVFADLAVKSLTTQDLSSFTSGGPDASRILGPFGDRPKDGSSWDSSRAVVLPAKGPGSALTIDLGDVHTICADGISCPPLGFQGSGDDTYRLEYSLDGGEWSFWVDVPPLCSCNALETNIGVRAPGTPSARYVRVWAVSTIGSSEKYSVSRLQFWSPGQPSAITLGKPARGPQPLLTSEPFPPADGSAAWNHPLATVLPDEGPESALTIDMGRVVHTVTQMGTPGVQLLVSGNDDYRLEYSNDGISWTLWVEIPQRCGCSELEQEFAFAPNVAAQYFRIYHPSGTPGDGKYSVAQIVFAYTLEPGGSQLIVARDERTFGPEALATNDELAPEGTSYDDTRYATVLGGSGTEYALLVDLGKSAGRGINRVKIQAHYNDVYNVDISPDGLSWRLLYTAAAVKDSGLRTRDSGDSLTDPSTGKPWVGRYVRVYAVSGSGKYSVSELQIFNDVLVAGCPFDPDANAIALGSAECSYSGDIVGDAALPASEPLVAHANDLKVTAHCDGAFGSSTIQLWPLFSGSGSATCDIDDLVVDVDVDFCAVSCGQGADPPFELTYQQVESVDPTFAKPNCDTSEAFESAELEDAVADAIGEVASELLIPAVVDAQNELLRDETPFPGQTLPTGEPAVCTP